jgi:hypothetical protein
MVRVHRGPETPNYRRSVDVATEAGPRTAAPTDAQRWTMVVAVLVGVVLRWWDLGGPVATFDESFTGAYSHLPLSAIPAALRVNDAHPPLDYLLRHFMGSTGDTFALRLPSAVFACLTLVLVAWWMWRRGWFGVAVVALTSLSAFQLLYAHQARMYSLAVLCGTVVAVVAERWLERPAARWRWIMAVALLVGLFDHSGFLLAAGGIGLLPGLRRDREAWWWRGTVVGAVGVWAAVWGPSFVEQTRKDHSSWIPFTSVSAVGSTLNGFVDVYTVLSVLVVALVLAGAWWLWRQDENLGRIWVCLFLAPFVVACVIGLRSHFLLSRTLAFAAWSVPLALAAVVDRARRHSGPALLAALAMLFIVVVPSVVPSIGYHEDSSGVLRAAQHAVQPGDAVAVYPSWLSPLAIWNLDADRHSPGPGALAGRGAFVFVRGDKAFDGRVWLIEPDSYAMSTTGLRPCADQPHLSGTYVLTCFEVPEAGSP